MLVMTAPLVCLLLGALYAPHPGVHVDREQRAVRAFAVPASPAVVAAHRGRAPAPARPEKGRFLIASRNLIDPNFSETVVLLLAHDARGAMGVIINRPTAARMASALPDIEELRDRPDRVYLGGPVAEDLMLILIRSATRPESSRPIFADVYTTGSLAALRKALAKRGKANRLRSYVGHAGWGAAQLDREIARGDWYVTSADAATIFDTTPSEIWPKLIDRFSGQWTRGQGGEPLVAPFLASWRFISLSD